MNEREKAQVFTVVAAVLHLGNIMFEQDHSEMKGIFTSCISHLLYLQCIITSGGSVICPKSQATVRSVANLLGIDCDDLQRCLTYRVMTTTKKGTIGTVIK